MEVSNEPTQPPDAEQVYAYFLGELTAAESERFADQVFQDEDLAEHVFALEDELIELYLHDGLSPERRARFAQHYLTTDERHAKVAFATAFEHELAAEAAPPPEIKTPWWQTLFVTPRLAWALLLMLAATAGALWLARIRTPMPDDIAQTASPTLPPAPSVTATVTPTPLATPSAPPRPAVVVALTLAPGLTMSSGQALPVLRLPATATAADLTLQLYRADFTRYRAVLQTEGATVWTSGTLRPRTKANGEAAVTVRVPAERLSRSDFLLLLFDADRSKQSTDAPVASYSFRVQPE